MRTSSQKMALPPLAWAACEDGSSPDCLAGLGLAKRERDDKKNNPQENGLFFHRQG